MAEKKDAQSTGQVSETDSQLDVVEKSRGERPLFIVGIGASAGGLEACEAFFNHMPPDSGMAFVLVQHLAPDHNSMLVDLLQRSTQMPVSQVEGGMRIQPNHVYVIPPNQNMGVLHRTLHLIEPVERRGLRLPIDFFFDSLAEDQTDQAICIILSGTGSDGTRGIKAIRGVGGMTMVQSPDSAAYDGMPRNAIATGVVDYVLPPGDMPAQLLSYVEHRFKPGIKRETPSPLEESDELEKIFILLRSQTKHDFSLYKSNTIMRRIERRMAVNHVKQVTDYVRYLQRNPLEIETLFRELLIGVTSFFRDQEAFAALEEHAIPSLFEDRQPNQPIRVWIAGCSTGEEAYSIAILLREHMNAIQQEFDVQIFATDIDPQAIEIARSGLYAENLVVDISPQRLQSFFVKEGATYQVSRQVREMVIFAIQSVTKDPPFSKIDLISCRNLLIYLGPDLQKRVIPLFHYALRPGGYLFLGTSETLGEFDRFFVPIDRKMKLFQHTATESIPQRSLDFTLPAPAEDDVQVQFAKPHTLNIRELTETTLLQDHTPPSVIINDQGTILYFHGNTNHFLEPVRGEASLNLLRMAREGLKLPLSAAMRQAYAQQQNVTYDQIRLSRDGQDRLVTIIIKPVTGTTSGQPLFLVVFEETMTPNTVETMTSTGDVVDERDRRLADMEKELQATREYLQTTVEELETTNEELKSTNEELQSANEELQSTNEELETAKEELQSVNEELVTVNSEMQSNIDELTVSNDDLNNLLASVDVGMIFLDLNLHIQRFNPSATQIIHLIESDVGRPIGHLVSNLNYDTLVEDAQRVLASLIPSETEVQTTNGEWYWMQIRPYRTTHNSIVGLVITFADITGQKQAALAIRDAQQYAENIINAIRDSVIVLDEDLKVVSANEAFYQTFDLSPGATKGKWIYELSGGQWNSPTLRERLEDIVQSNATFDDFEMPISVELDQERSLKLNARRIDTESSERLLILLVIEDMMARKD